MDRGRALQETRQSEVGTWLNGSKGNELGFTLYLELGQRSVNLSHEEVAYGWWHDLVSRTTRDQKSIILCSPRPCTHQY